MLSSFLRHPWLSTESEAHRTCRLSCRIGCYRCCGRWLGCCLSTASKATSWASTSERDRRTTSEWWSRVSSVSTRCLRTQIQTGGCRLLRNRSTETGLLFRWRWLKTGASETDWTSTESEGHFVILWCSSRLLSRGLLCGRAPVYLCLKHWRSLCLGSRLGFTWTLGRTVVRSSGRCSLTTEVILIRTLHFSFIILKLFL